MTHIVNIGIEPAAKTTKKALKQALQERPQSVYFANPSIMGGWGGPADTMPKGKTITATNHPKRSMFAQITRKGNGAFVVK